MKGNGYKGGGANPMIVTPPPHPPSPINDIQKVFFFVLMKLIGVHVASPENKLGVWGGGGGGGGGGENWVASLMASPCSSYPY